MLSPPALAKLPPVKAATIVLRHYHGYTNRAIAQALGVPERTVASRLSSAKQRLRVPAGAGAAARLIFEGGESSLLTAYLRMRVPPGSYSGSSATCPATQVPKISTSIRVPTIALDGTYA